MKNINTNIKSEVSTKIRVENAVPTRKPRLVVDWPTGKFTIQEMIDKYSDHPMITVRHRIGRQVDMGNLIQVGQSAGDLGRPQVYYVHRRHMLQYLEGNPETTETFLSQIPESAKSEFKI